MNVRTRMSSCTSMFDDRMLDLIFTARTFCKSDVAPSTRNLSHSSDRNLLSRSTNNFQSTIRTYTEPSIIVHFYFRSWLYGQLPIAHSETSIVIILYPIRNCSFSQSFIALNRIIGFDLDFIDLIFHIIIVSLHTFTNGRLNRYRNFVLDKSVVVNEIGRASCRESGV